MKNSDHTYVVGDIHGCFPQLKALVKLILKKDKMAQFIFLGDYVNKGDNTKRVIDFLIDLNEKNECVFIRGNHEQLMLDAKNSFKEFEVWNYAGGFSTLLSYRVKNQTHWAEHIPKEHWKFLKHTKWYFQLEDKAFIHGCLDIELPIDSQSLDTLIWKKNKDPKKHPDFKEVYCGHTIQRNKKINYRSGNILMDTGAYKYGWLSAMNINTKEYIQINANNETRTGKLSIKKNKA